MKFRHHHHHHLLIKFFYYTTKIPLVLLLLILFTHALALLLARSSRSWIVKPSTIFKMTNWIEFDEFQLIESIPLLLFHNSLILFKTHHHFKHQMAPTKLTLPFNLLAKYQLNSIRRPYGNNLFESAVWRQVNREINEKNFPRLQKPRHVNSTFIKWILLTHHNRNFNNWLTCSSYSLCLYLYLSLTSTRNHTHTCMHSCMKCVNAAEIN